MFHAEVGYDQRQAPSIAATSYGEENPAKTGEVCSDFPRVEPHSQDWSLLARFHPSTDILGVSPSSCIVAM